MWLAAASTASTASAARPGGFDVAATLPWSVPLLLMAPLAGFVFLLSGVRGRRSAGNLGLLTVAVVLGADLLTGWARFRARGTYQAGYQWLNLPVATTGDSHFQGFGIDAALRVDHLTVALVAGLALVFGACLLWHRVGGRQEPGPVRHQVNALLLLFAAVGVLLSGDLSELVAFWLLAGVASYLLLGQRWGSEGAATGARVALWLPYLGDLALVGAAGLLYSRFGELRPDRLFPILGATPGVGLKTLTAVALLVFLAVATRAAIWPFSAWQTSAAGASPSLVALVAGVWPLLAGDLLYRLLPLFGAAGLLGHRLPAAALAVAAVAGPALALVGVELRRSLLLASSGAVSLGLLGILYPPSAVVAVTGLVAIAAGRVAALLAGASAAAAMRTADLRETGGGVARLRVTSLALLGGAVAVALGAAAAPAWRPQSAAWIAFAVGELLAGAGMVRVYVAVAHGPLRRRRAFEPNRVREPAPGVTAATLLAVATGLLAAGLGFLTAWVGFIDGARHLGPAGIVSLLWLLPAGLGLGAGLAMIPRQVAVLAAGAGAGSRFRGLSARAGAGWGRFVSGPGLAAMEETEGRLLPAAEAGLAHGLEEAGGRMGSGRRPWLPLALGLALALLLGLGIAAGGFR